MVRGPRIRDVRALLAYLEGRGVRGGDWDDHRLYVLITLILATDIDPNEALRLRTEDIDFERHTIRVPDGDLVAPGAWDRASADASLAAACVRAGVGPMTLEGLHRGRGFLRSAIEG